MTDKNLDEAWRGWLRENLARRCDPEELVGVALRQGFSIASIRECMGSDFPEASEMAQQALRAASAGEPFTAPAKKYLDPSWKNWVNENLAGGADPAQMVEILLKHGFSPQAIVDAMGDQCPAAVRVGGPFLSPAQAGVEYAALARPPLLRRPPEGLQDEGGGKLQLYTLDGFLSVPECQALIALVNHHLRPSTITFGETSYRTSRTC